MRSTLLALCALAGPAAADTKDHVAKLTEAATHVAESVYRASGDFSGEGMATELLTRSLACVKAAKAAFTDKVPRTEVVMVPVASRFSADVVLETLPSEVVGDQRKTTVGAIRDFCVKGVHAAAIGDLQTTLLTLDSWEQALADNSRKDLHIIATNILGDAKKCFPKLEMVDASGADKNTPIKLWNRTIKASEAKALICEPARARTEQVLAARQAAADASLAPWRKALAGDKLRIYDERKMNNVWIRGAGGKKLDTPAAMAKSALWFETFTFDGGDGYTHWRLVRYQFNGTKLVKGPTEKTGRGNEPPSAAYR